MNELNYQSPRAHYDSVRVRQMLPRRRLLTMAMRLSHRGSPLCVDLSHVLGSILFIDFHINPEKGKTPTSCLKSNIGGEEQDRIGLCFLWRKQDVHSLWGSRDWQRRSWGSADVGFCHLLEYKFRLGGQHKTLTRRGSFVLQKVCILSYVCKMNLDK